MSKKYYYIKLSENFYNREEIKILESRENGYIYSNIYMKMILLSLKYEGKLAFKGYLPYDLKTLATILGHDVDNVKGAIEILKKLEMIEILDDNTIYMLDIQELIGSVTDEALRKREYRKRIEAEKKNKQIEDKNNDVTMSGQCPDILEIDKEKDIDINKEKDINLKHYGGVSTPPVQTENSKNSDKLKNIDNSKINDSKNKRDIDREAEKVLWYLNKKAERKFRKVHKYTRARLREYSLPDLIDVIDWKVKEWKDNPEFNRFLRQETLFSPFHFDTYLEEAQRHLVEVSYQWYLDNIFKQQLDKAVKHGWELPKKLLIHEWGEKYHAKWKQKRDESILTSEPAR